MSDAPKTRKRLSFLELLFGGIPATLLVYMALGFYLGWPGSHEDLIFLSVLSAVFGVPIGLAVVMAAGMLRDAEAKRRKADAGTSLSTPLNEKDVTDLMATFSVKSTEELNTIYAARETGEYRAEAIEAIRRLLVARGGLKG